MELLSLCLLTITIINCYIYIVHSVTNTLDPPLTHQLAIYTPWYVSYIRLLNLYSAGRNTTTPKVHIKISSIFVDTMLDSSTKVNIITRSLVDKARLTIQTNLILALKTISGDIRKFNGAYKDIEVSISSISNIQTIIVIEEIDYKLILGCPFFYNV